MPLKTTGGRNGKEAEDLKTSFHARRRQCRKIADDETPLHVRKRRESPADSKLTSTFKKTPVREHSVFSAAKRTHDGHSNRDPQQEKKGTVCPRHSCRPTATVARHTIMHSSKASSVRPRAGYAVQDASDGKQPSGRPGRGKAQDATRGRTGFALPHDWRTPPRPRA